MKKIPVLVSIVLIAGVAMSLAFTHPIQSVNGVVKSYSPGASITVSTSHGDFVYLLRPSTLTWAWGATSWSGGIANTGGNGSASNSSSASSSSSSNSSSSSTATTATTAPSTGTTATAKPSTSGSGSSSSGTSSTTTSTAASINGLSAGARVTVFGVCNVGMFSTRHNTNGQSTNAANGENARVCLALAVVVRGPSARTVPATGGAGAGTSTSTAPVAAATETPTAVMTAMPAVTMTPTP